MTPKSPRVWSRRAAVAVQVAVASSLLLGSAALTIDMGSIFKAKAELQNVADAAALAAAGQLAVYGDTDPKVLARQAAVDVAARNKVTGEPATIDPALDVEFGRGILNPATGKYDFVATEDLPDAVRVRVRRTVDSADGPIDLMFARIWGRDHKDLAASAIAMLVPRDISVVIDLSASMNDDSELRQYNKASINLYDIWTALPKQADPSQTDDLGFTSVVSVTDNGDGTSTVNVDLTSDASEATAALSHVTFGLPQEVWDSVLATATTTGQYDAPVTGTDPTTGVEGLKFDAIGDGLGEDGVQQTHSFSFAVANDYLASMTMGVATKAGQGTAEVSHGLQPGPTWGNMDGWGTFAPDPDYAPAGDPGLMYLPKYGDWSGNPTVISLLQQAGYNAEEVYALTHSQSDDSWYHNRVAAVLGLARWNSGKPDGYAGGNGNDYFGDSEMTWLVDYPYQGGSWTDWIKNYVRSSGTEMYHAHSGFRYRYGLKTFVNYLLERRRCIHETEVLWQTPEQPLQAVKTALRVCTDVIESLHSDDQVSLEMYAETAHHLIDLTMDYESVADQLDGMQAGHYDCWTYLGGGLQKAIDELSSERARSSAKKVILLMTDGLPNVTPEGQAGYDSWVVEAARSHALAKAQEAREMGIRIYCISVGTNADRELMQQIASIGDGEEFFAAGDIDQYAAQLTQIFGELGGRRPVVLIK